MSPIFTATHCPRGMRTGRIGIGDRFDYQIPVSGILAAVDPVCEHALILVECVFEVQSCPTFLCRS